MSNKAVENMSTKAIENISEVGHPKTSTESKPMASEVAQPQSDLFLDKPEVGVTGNMDSEVAQPKTASESKPMASEVAIWGVSTVTGSYQSTDFIVSVAKGNTMHCTARSTIAHNLFRLKEGVVNSIKDFVFHPNKDEYRVMKDASL
nr:hypothetical protein [Tanacetum cinerariifolium]